MQRNEARFTDKAVLYQKFRPSYPQELVDYLYTRVGFTANSHIADIGSGTGIFSQLLLERGSRVYGVEPNKDMQQAAMQFLAGFLLFTAITASAEATALSKQSIDFITVSQAFHWFDRAAFKEECQRILNPDGQVVLIWNARDYSHPVIQAEFALRQKYSDQESKEDPSKLAKDWTDFFDEGICEYKTCRNDLYLTREEYIGLTLSRSWAPNKK